MHFLIENLLVTRHEPTETQARESESTALRELVYLLCFNRTFRTAGNQRAKELILAYLDDECDYAVADEFGNIEAGWGEKKEGQILLGAHYDSPPGSPGADDNLSAVSVLMRTIHRLRNDAPENVRFVFFNGEEFNLFGSRRYASRYTPSQAVILEMVGYYSDEPGSQQCPDPFPKFDKGNFLAVIANNISGKLSKSLFKAAKESEYRVPLVGLMIPFGAERRLAFLQDVLRSDHTPFWEKSVPAVMITDTANFRNANYHRPTDQPDTLDYDKMSELVLLLEKFVKNENN